MIRGKHFSIVTLSHFQHMSFLSFQGKLNPKKIAPCVPGSLQRISRPDIYDSWTDPCVQDAVHRFSIQEFRSRICAEDSWTWSRYKSPLRRFYTRSLCSIWQDLWSLSIQGLPRSLYDLPDFWRCQGHRTSEQDWCQYKRLVPEFCLALPRISLQDLCTRPGHLCKIFAQDQISELSEFQ